MFSGYKHLHSHKLVKCPASIDVGTGHRGLHHQRLHEVPLQPDRKDLKLKGHSLKVNNVSLGHSLQFLIHDKCRGTSEPRNSGVKNRSDYDISALCLAPVICWHAYLMWWQLFDTVTIIRYSHSWTADGSPTVWRLHTRYCVPIPPHMQHKARKHIIIIRCLALLPAL